MSNKIKIIKNSIIIKSNRITALGRVSSINILFSHLDPSDKCFRIVYYKKKKNYQEKIIIINQNLSVPTKIQ